MIKKFLFGLIFLFITTSVYGGILTVDTGTTTFDMPYWTRGARNWDDRMNLGIESVDSILTILSTDVGLISDTVVIISNDIAALTDDVVATVGGQVGRLRWISDDGSECFIKLYSGK